MNKHHSETRKIDPTRGATLGDGSPNDADRIEIGPTQLAFDEWAAAGIELPNLDAMRTFRHKRLTHHLVDRGYAGLLMFDPLNIRYATDSTNMQLWNTHNPFRACLLCPDGYMVLWDYKNAPFLSSFNPLVREVRAGADFFYFDRGDQIGAAADVFAADVKDILRQHGGAEDKRLAVDKVMLHGLRSLEGVGYHIVDGEEVTEKARAVKGPDEINAMRCSIHACEAAMYIMEDFARTNVGDGKTCEDDIWAILHVENIRRGGEWIETRLLSSGPRTNPWFQESGPRICQQNEIIAFDTDLIGAYGICTDISRTWWVGPDAPRPDMVYAFQHAHEHIMTNMQMLKPGVMIPDLTAGCHQLDEKFMELKYGCLMHGVGLCDEWPLVRYPDKAVPNSYDYPLEPGMVLCVEAAVGEVGGDFSIKLEDQVLITEDGFENLISYPFDPRLLP
ncbi:MAG: dimethylsulfonioproprionate lyase DddP [Lentilitoribacter sp.]